MQRKVLAFVGHVNEYKTCRSTVDKLGSFVAAGTRCCTGKYKFHLCAFFFWCLAGSDGNIRIWSTRTGALIHQLHRMSCNGVPHIAYSESLYGKPSLLVTENSSIQVYQV